MWDFLNNFSIDVWCICLKERDDRFEYVKKEFKKVDLINLVKFHRPNRNSNGARGCLSSHKFCAETSLKTNRHSLVFEDDVFFSDDWEEKLDTIIDFLSSNENWDILRLGCAITSLIKQSSVKNIWKCKSYNTHAIIYNKKITHQLFDMSNFVDNTHIDDYLHDSNYLDYSLVDMCYQKAELGSDNDWFGCDIIQKFMLQPLVYEKIQKYNNKQMTYIHFLPIYIQECVSMWNILMKLGLMTKKINDSIKNCFK